MTTLHLSKDEIAALVVGDDGSVTVELTAEGARALEAVVAKRIAKRSRNVQIVESPDAVPRDGGFAAGLQIGFAHGRGPGMPPLRA